MSLPEVCVCYLLRETRHGTEVLLGVKKTGLGEGKIVGPGGKLELGESAPEAVIREVREETGLVLAEGDLRYAGRVEYWFPSRPGWSQISNVFVARLWGGEPVVTDELEPVWVRVSEIPWHRMWDDAQYWLGQVLEGGEIQRTFTFASDNQTVT